MTEPIDKIKSEIQSAIDEIREKEKYHASCIKENNKFVIMGLEIALDIIKRNEKPLDISFKIWYGEIVKGKRLCRLK